MAVRTEKDLSEAQKGYWLKAQSAVDLKNYDYAITLLQDILKEEPEFLSARTLLRRSEIINTKGNKSLFSMGGGGKPGLLKKDPKGAMESAEKALTNNPFDIKANQLLHDAALAMDMPETAQLALETMAEGHPKDTKVMHKLAEFYLDHGHPERAVDVYSKIAQIDPSDLAAVKKSKDAAARHSMDRGGWERSDTDYRAKLNTEVDHENLERESKTVLSAEAIDERIGQLYEKAQAEPDNVNWPRQIAALVEQKEDWDTAIQWYEHALSLSGGSDPGLQRKISDIQLHQVESQIEAYEKALKNPEVAEADKAEYRQELDKLKHELSERQLNIARQRVGANPTDLDLRLELGQKLFQVGQYKDAIPELQKARNSPSARLKAMMLLGRCYKANGMMEIAAKTLKEAKDQSSVMDTNKKEITYELGLIYEEMGKPQDSIQQFTEIYEVDYGYRDVAKRVESSYTDSGTGQPAVR